MSAPMIEQVLLRDVDRVRHDVLRPNQGPAAAITEVDNHPCTVHFVAEIADAIVGIVSSGPETFPPDDAVICWACEASLHHLHEEFGRKEAETGGHR
ncbi:hypothetical protein ABIC07_008924 [Bradyrhizobium sp. RT9a]